MFNRIITSLTLVFFVLSSIPAIAQDDDAATTTEGSIMAKMEDSLILFSDSLYLAPIPDTRLYYNDQFVKLLIRTLKNPNSYDYPFKKLNAKMNIIIAPDDKSFRMFNWVIAAPDDNDRRYYAAIQMPGEKLKLYGLTDYNDKLTQSPEDSVLTGGKWLGALYYRIMGNEVDGQMVYTMFGVNESNRISKKKVLDPMIITEKGPQFGAQIFGVMSQKTGQPIQRFILEFKKGVQVSLNWDEEKKAIYFDRLTSEAGDPNRKYTYVSTGQYDGFRWQNEKWNVVKDLIPVLELKDGAAPSGSPTTPETR